MLIKYDFFLQCLEIQSVQNLPYQTVESQLKQNTVGHSGPGGYVQKRTGKKL